LAWVRLHEILRTIPFLLLTSSESARDRDRAQALGADGYLVKPADWSGFSKVLKAVLKAGD
jgi:CheY-like chemotaxis protein